MKVTVEQGNVVLADPVKPIVKGIGIIQMPQVPVLNFNLASGPMLTEDVERLVAENEANAVILQTGDINGVISLDTESSRVLLRVYPPYCIAHAESGVMELSPNSTITFKGSGPHSDLLKICAEIPVTD